MYFVHEMRGKMSQKCFEAMTDIAKPAEPVNGQDERRINAPPLTVPPVFAKGQSRRESPKMAFRPFQILEKETLQDQKESGQAL